MNIIPNGPGLLPKWMLFVSALAIFNSIQNCLTTSLTARIYNHKPQLVNPLQARTFGVWTFTSAIVRFYAAHNINNKVVYDIAIWTYAIVIAHYISELLYYRTSKLSAGIISPLIVGTASFVWMITQYDFYVKS
ncbi:Erg28-like protein [Wallemia mellicola CBS 633.66]|uniref:Erg28-like protein n=1 Tax=Wallemia mellicola (strain ATCC MYA-4683 / CBS 633.66) TaxID=671144 RepID=I4Y7H5_WALMC|nr:Erg28-like protein [Wallemia mellicola CBS 633.66]EIM19917.1 Erg28-like protein [Wallemia mellicola CBS 633.66]|eukprot:XP_006960058.1 Erg28-like protein [Wallemia mellicola CBS 633.66]